MTESGILPGQITVSVEEQPEITAEGKLNATGWLSGMSRIYTALLGLWGDFSLSSERVHVQAAEMEKDVGLEALAVAVAA